MLGVSRPGIGRGGGVLRPVVKVSAQCLALGLNAGLLDAGEAAGVAEHIALAIADDAAQGLDAEGVVAATALLGRL
jgi:hypothetical protein